ncbi:hypothetical protein HY837_03490 [archaeon]|nr:hypothetical protein [archaeon]
MNCINITIILSFLLLIVACDPSYRMEFPDLTEEKYNHLPLEEKFEVYINASWYIDMPHFIYENIAKEGEKVVPLIVAYIESSASIEQKGRAIDLLAEVNKYSNLKSTSVEAFLLKKAQNSSDPNLGSYNYALRMIRPEIEEELVVTPGFENVPGFYTYDKDVTKYADLIKEKIMQETGMTQKELDDRFSIVGYTKGEKIFQEFPVYPKDNKTLAIGFVSRIDWVEVYDYFEFYFLDDKGNELPVEEVKQQIKVPFYFNIKKLKSRAEVEEMVAKTNSYLKKINIPLEAPNPNHNYININYLNKEILLDVSGIKDEKKNQCLAGTINLLNEDIRVNNVPCFVE